MPVTAPAPPTRFELRLLGGLGALDADGAHLSVRPQALQLLTYLALRRGATVDPLQIVEAFWPGYGEQGLNVLQTLIWLLRRAFGARIVATEHLEGGRLERAAALWEGVIALDPLAEQAYEGLIECHEAAGRDDAARRIRRGFRRILDESMGA